jgi:hypothetical protein
MYALQGHFSFVYIIFLFKAVRFLNPIILILLL